MINKKTKINSKNGFIALFAVLLSMLILAMALGITNTAFKESLLSVQAKEGHLALFAADSGVECALYGDLSVFGFGDSLTPPNSTFDCVGANGNIGALGTLDFINSISPYSFELSLSDNSCVRVTVDKNYPEFNADDTTDPNITNTKIDSFGYNVACGDVDNPDNLKKVERALRVMYAN